MGFFSPSKQSSYSYQTSGLRDIESPGAYMALMNRTPGDFTFALDNLQNRADSGGNILGLSNQGLMNAQLQGVDTLGRQAFNQASSNFALRGFNRPENIGGVVGSALTALSPQLMSLVGQNVLNNQQLQSNRFAQLQDMMNLYPDLLGGKQFSSGSGRDPGFGYAGTIKFTEGFKRAAESGGSGGGGLYDYGRAAYGGGAYGDKSR